MRAALAGSDLVVVSAGSSVGARDETARVVTALGDLWCHGLALKPGKPTLLAAVAGVPLVGLPGNPLSAIVCFCVFIEPALRRLAGEPAPRPRLERGRLAVPARASDGRTTFLTATLRHAADGVLEATPTARQGSHMTGALGESDGFAVAPEDAGELRAGAPVDVLRLG